MLVKVTACAAVIALTMTTTARSAEPTVASKETARALLTEGDAQFAQKDYAAALKAYLAADALMHVPTTGVEVARAQEASGQLLEARDTCLRVTRSPTSPDEPAAFATARTRCDALAQTLQKRIPSIRIAISGVPSGVEPRVSIDGEDIPSAAVALPRRINPGKHVIVAVAPSYARAERHVTVPESETTTATIALEPDGVVARAASPANPSSAPATLPAPPPTESSSRIPTYAWVGFGVGAAGLITGTITGLMTLSKASAVKNVCISDHCPASTQSDIDAGTTLANVSNVGFGLAVIGAGVGIYGVLTAPKSSSSQAAWQPYVGPTGGGVRGSF